MSQNKTNTPLTPEEEPIGSPIDAGGGYTIQEVALPEAVDPSLTGCPWMVYCDGEPEDAFTDVMGALTYVQEMTEGPDEPEDEMPEGMTVVDPEEENKRLEQRIIDLVALNEALEVENRGLKVKPAWTGDLEAWPTTERFTKGNVVGLVEDSVRDLCVLLEPLGLNAKMSGSVKYTALEASATITWQVASEDAEGKLEEARKTEWNNYCSRYGMKPEHYGQVVEIRGRDVAICGVAPKNTKYPIIYRDIRNGKTYKGSPAMFRVPLGIL